MKKILIFPLLNSMPSGHHQVADAFSEYVAGDSFEVECKKVDLLSEWNAKAEMVTVKAYLQWIRRSPHSYGWIYRQFAFRSKEKHSAKYFEWLFMKKVETIISEEKPDLIVCTHGFPSFFINKLKESGKCPVPCLNIYTDFFINDVWGRSRIEFHFAATEAMKDKLQQEYQIPRERIFVTGIPVSGQFREGKRSKEPQTVSVLVSGGSTGLSNIIGQLKEGIDSSKWEIRVLCGTNKRLFKQLTALNNPAIKPLAYISSKEEMNRLYNEVDVLVTKPGGVTISEALEKELPIFVSAPLPGQEEINLRYLIEQNLAFALPSSGNLLEFIARTLEDTNQIKRHQAAVQKHKQSLLYTSPHKITNAIELMLIS